MRLCGVSPAYLGDKMKCFCKVIKASKWHESSTVSGGLYPKDTEPKPAPHRAVNRKHFS